MKDFCFSAPVEDMQSVIRPVKIFYAKKILGRTSFNVFSQHNTNRMSPAHGRHTKERNSVSLLQETTIKIYRPWKDFRGLSVY